MTQKFCNICIFASFWIKLQKLEGIKVMPHPAYSLNLVLSNPNLFQCKAHFLYSWCFNNQEKVKASVKEFSKDKNWYQHGIKELTERWYSEQRCIWLNKTPIYKLKNFISLNWVKSLLKNRNYKIFSYNKKY